MAPDSLRAEHPHPVAEGAAGRAHVVILLALYNGGTRLREQLDSLAGQSHGNWSLIVSDDGSTDDGPEVLRRFAEEHPGREISLIHGPRMGFAQNFLHLLRAADPDADFVSFCDQDDVWLPDKTARAVAALSRAGPEVPAMYCGRTIHCDEALRPLRPSPLFARPPSFSNALVQNIGGGNTMVLNKSALRMLAAASTRVEAIVSHDWWAYQVVSGAGGTVIYETEPGLLYRQHGANAVGANGTTRTALQRLVRVMQGRFRDWNDQNVAALSATADLLTPENRALLETFRAARAASLPRRLKLMRALGLHRQTRRDNLALWFAVLTGRV
ncbi:glycosyltransferase family 2 protein [Palleronia sp. KMU-117]|uniref:glycosyltransferase family 2 protein n=1 Tax=Palleronia sp. KMU-117 TaxID=3434108 RepID=UPI003D71500A